MAPSHAELLAVIARTYRDRATRQWVESHYERIEWLNTALSRMALASRPSQETAAFLQRLGLPVPAGVR